MTLNICEKAIWIIKKLEENGFEAFAVGGCVRDLIMGRTPSDYDITTSAKPYEIKSVFSSCLCVNTGIKHGTVTVILGKEGFEVTTYRIDGEYSDGRHPDKVCFSDKIEDDLARRDFTVNAMAYNETSGLIDIFGGKDDIMKKRIKCVREPSERFKEDYLRIMRAVRFSSQLGFDIEENTKKAMYENKDGLINVSSERLSAELTKLLMGENVLSVLLNHHEILEVFIPEITQMVGFLQHSPYHKYDVWEHTAHMVASCVNERTLRTAALFHDIGKPSCYKQDRNGRGHFKGHDEKGAFMAETIMKRLRYDGQTIRNVKELILNHSDRKYDEISIKKKLSRLGKEHFFMLLDLQRADSSSKQDFCLKELSIMDNAEKTANAILARGDCISIFMLNVNGEDMLKAGLEGREIGQTLALILDNIICSKLENNHDEIMDWVKKHIIN